MKNFSEINIEKLNIDFYNFISKNWLALAVGNEENNNAMTISWGQFGSVWKDENGRTIPTAMILVRPSRHTNSLLKTNEFFTLNWFENDCRNELSFLGSKSGRDVENKITASGLTPIFLENSVAINEVKLIFVCKKIYVSSINKSGFLNEEILKKNYPNKNDLHDVYIAEIVKVLKEEK